MSQMYWLCQGIGFEQGAVTPYLDAEKLENLIKERAEESKVTGEFKRAYEYDQKDNADQVQLLMDQIVCNETYQLAGLLASENEESVFIGVTDGDGQYFLLFPPRYPWENTGEFLSQEVLAEYITDFVLQFCRDDVSRQDIIGIIDADIYEVGCG